MSNTECQPMAKRLLSALFAITLVMGLMPVNAYAANSDSAQSETQGQEQQEPQSTDQATNNDEGAASAGSALDERAAEGEASNTEGEPADSQPAASAGQAESTLDGGALFASSLGGDDEAEAVSDVSLAANRWYPILGRFEIEVGETIEIAGRTAYYSSHYNWTSSDTSVATAKIGDPDRSRGTITGLKPGRVEIVHEWHDMNYREDHFVVTVAPVAKHVKLTGTSVNVVYDGTSHAAGAATATDDNGHDVLVEYQKADGTWTENPAEITATNVADSTRINIRASVPDHYYDYVYATENLTVSKRPVTFTGESAIRVPTGGEQSLVGITANGLAEGQQWSGLSYLAKGTEPGEHAGAFTGEPAITADGKDVTSNYEVKKAPGKLIIVSPDADYSKIEDNVTLTAAPVSAVYDAKAHAAGAATATDKNGHDVKIEYRKAEGAADATAAAAECTGDDDGWTEDPADIVATSVGDSTVVDVRASVPGYYHGYVYATEALTILAQSIDPDDIGAYLGVEISELERMLFYDGEEQLWAAVLDYEGIELVEGVDYTVTYNIEDLVCAGIVTMVIEGIGNYAGTLEASYRIYAQSINPDDGESYGGVKVDSPGNVAYDGEAHKWAPSVTGEDGAALEAGADYAVSYLRGAEPTDDFTSAGEITVVIEGRGNYTGKVERTYAIEKAAPAPESAAEAAKSDNATKAGSTAAAKSATPKTGDTAAPLAAGSALAAAGALAALLASRKLRRNARR